MATVYEDLQQKLAVNYIDYHISNTDVDYLQYLINNNYVSSTDDETVYLVNVENLLGYSLKSGNGTYNNDGVYKDLYIIEVTANNTEKELSLYYYDKNATSNYIGSLGTIKSVEEEVISNLPSDFFNITDDGTVSINSIYIGLGSYSSQYFYDDTNKTNPVTEIVIPKQVNGITVTSIADRCFYYCPEITSITIPSSVTSIIGDNPFLSCYNLRNIEVSENNKNYSSVDGVLFNKNKSTLITYPDGKYDTSYEIPSSVTSIGNRAFNTVRFENVTIPNSVISIGDDNFYASNSNYSYTVTIKGYADQSEFDEAVSSGRITLGTGNFNYYINLIFEK